MRSWTRRIASSTLRSRTQRSNEPRARHGVCPRGARRAADAIATRSVAPVWPPPSANFATTNRGAHRQVQDDCLNVHVAIFLFYHIIYINQLQNHPCIDENAISKNEVHMSPTTWSRSCAAAWGESSSSRSTYTTPR